MARPAMGATYASALARRNLPSLVTLEPPNAPGPGWGTATEHVPALLEDTLANVTDPRMGGLLQVKQTTLYVLSDVVLDADWRVTDEVTGRSYIAGAPSVNGPGPLNAVPLRAGH